jgi:hypothetical protein
MGHGFTTRDGFFLDPQGRHALLRGVNLGGSSKVPARPDGATWRGVDFVHWREVSFVGRPFPLVEADAHLRRIAHWGFDVLRLLVTWEAIEPAGPGVYDEEYLDYVGELVRRAGRHGLLVFIDPHQDVWSRFSGGDGAPFWTFELAGLLPERFVPAQAVVLDAQDWPANALRVPAATMWTLFFFGDRLCPELRGVQGRLQEHYIRALCAVAERVADLDNVLGYDTLNEPDGGFAGRGEEMTRPRRFFAGGPEPFSTLEHLAAADGRAVVAADGRVLNPQAIPIWRAGCPWRRLGIWDVGADGRPALLRPDHFKTLAGRELHVWRDGMVPFIRRLRDALRRVHPDCMLFLEGSPVAPDTPWDDPDPLVCDARHWYDVPTLVTRRFDPECYEAFGQRAAGAAGIATIFEKQLAGLRGLSRERMGGPPMLLGEFGIPYEMNGGEAFRSGDWRAHEILLDANYRALEALLLNSTQWNYTADNRHEHGDGWNHEDLSIFSPDDCMDPADLDSGGRGVRAFCRPRLLRAAGRPLRTAFDLESRVFELEIEAHPDAGAPTELYVPRLHYPAGARIRVSAGKASHDPAGQRLLWDAEGARGRLSLRLSPA